MSIVSILSLLLLGSIEAQRIVDDQLLAVNVVIRHADRAATSAWATNDSSTILFRGNGELTDLGIDNAYKMGLDFARRYVESGFVDSRYLPSQVYVKSSIYNRCLMSASSFTNGLFRKTAQRNSIVPPIYTLNKEDDGMLVPLLTCDDGWEDAIERFNLTATRVIWSAAKKALMATEWPEECSTVPVELYDAIVAELPNKLIKMPKNYVDCAKGEGKKFNYKYIELLAGVGVAYNELRVKRVAGILTNELLNRFAAVENCITCTTEPKLSIYYTHDTTLLGLAQIFGLLDRFQGITPNFSSAFIFETRRNSDGVYVKIYQKDGENAYFEDTNNCVSNCSVAAIREATSKFAISEQIPCD